MTTPQTQVSQETRWRFAPSEGRPADFVATCDARQLYLQLSNHAGQGIGLFKMEPLGHQSRWGLTLRLKPGTYHYRYYADCGCVTTYVHPRQAGDTPLPMDGLDAVLTVPAAADSTNPSPLPIRSRVLDSFPRQSDKTTETAVCI
jgi:hypothetical protein